MKGLSAVLALLFAPVALAAPEHVRVSWCGGDSGTTMCITWNDASGGGNQVQYGTSATLTESAMSVSFNAPAPLGTIHEVELIGLAPNTTYFYRVGGAGAGWSDTYELQTGPKAADGCVPFSFAVLGDNRSQDESGADLKWHGILAETLEKKPALVLNTGDLVKDGDQIKQWKDYLEKTDPLHASTPIFPSIGNHDDDKVQGEGALYNMVFQLPRNSKTDTEDFYFVTYGDAIFVSLTTQNFKDDAFALQAEWLDKIFTENPRTWKFVFFHHPTYSSHGDIFGFGNHPPNEQKQNAAMVPIFDKHHVDIVFNGHNHYYERFQPSKGGGGSDQAKPVGSPAEGTIYIITGGAGAFTFDDIPLGDFDLSLIDLVCGNAAGSAKCDGRHHYVHVSIDENELKLDVIATAAQNFGTDVANIELIDSLTITKEPIDCAATPPPPEPDPEPAPPLEDPTPPEESVVVEEPSIAEPPPVQPDFGAATENTDTTDTTDTTDQPDNTEATTGSDGTGGTGGISLPNGSGSGSGTGNASSGSDSGGCQLVSPARGLAPLWLLCAVASILVFVRRRQHHLEAD